MKLTAEEQQLIYDYRELSEQGQEIIRRQIYMSKQVYKKKVIVLPIWKKTEIEPRF